MERVARLVHHRLQVPVQPHRVHEDERLAAAIPVRLVAAGGFALARLEVQAAAGCEAVEHLPQRRIHPPKEPGGLSDELARPVEGPERGPALDVHVEIPGTQLVDPEGLGAPGVQRPHQRHTDGLGRTVKGRAIRRRVVEAVPAGEHVIAVVVEPRVVGDLGSQLDHPVKDLAEPLGIGDAALPDAAPRRLAGRAVGLLEILRHFRKRVLP